MPYEITLVLRRDGVPFGSVGERCGYFLATLAVRLAASRGAGSPQARRWPDPDDRFPDPVPGGDGELALVPGCDRELFTFRHRDRGDAAGTGELRCTLRTIATWKAAAGWWRLVRRAVVEAWGSGGGGVRAVLTSAQLARFLTEVLDEAERAGASYRDLIDGTSPSGYGR